MTALPDGVRSARTATDRLDTHYLSFGPDDGIPVVLIHGNLSSARFYDETMAAAPGRYRVVAPDMRGFGDSEAKPLDGTRGLRDWSDDTRALIAALGIEGPVHLAGWSTGGAAISYYAIDHPDEVASLTLIDPVSPYGFGGTKDLDGTPCFSDYAGSGGGTASPEFVERLGSGDRGGDSDLSPRNVMNGFYWSPGHREPPEREDMLLGEVLKSVIGDGGYPGDSAPSANWPGVAPGTSGIMNALSGKYCNTSGIVNIEPKPPILWAHGAEDLVVSDNSMFEMGALGKLGAVPEWPGEEVYPPQPMVAQIRSVLDRYAAAGGSVRTEIFERSGHGPLIDAATRFREVFYGFLDGVS